MVQASAVATSPLRRRRSSGAREYSSISSDRLMARRLLSGVIVLRKFRKIGPVASRA